MKTYKKRMEALEKNKSQTSKKVLVFIDGVADYKGKKYKNEKEIIKEYPMLNDTSFIKIEFV
jgi:hypothetical protein